MVIAAGLTKVGLARETSAGTYVAPTFGVPIRNGNPIAVNDNFVDDEAFYGRLSAMAAASYPTVQDCVVTIEAAMWPTLLGHLCYAAFGTDTVSGTSTPYTHAYSVGTAQPYSYSITVQPGGLTGTNTLAVVEARLNELTINFGGVGENPSVQASFVGQLTSLKAAPTLTYSTDAPLLASQVSVALAGTTSTAVETASLTFARHAQPVHTLGGFDSFVGTMDLTGQLGLIFDAYTHWDYVGNNTQASVRMLIDDSTNSRSLNITASKVAWKARDLQLGAVNDYVKLGIGTMRGVYNSTDSGVAQVSVESGDATY